MLKAVLFWLLGQFLIPILRSELTEFTGPMAHKIIDFAARLTPEYKRQHLKQFWTTDIQDRPGKWAKVYYAMGHLVSGISIRWTHPGLFLKDAWRAVVILTIVESLVVAGLQIYLQTTKHLHAFIPFLTIQYYLNCLLGPLFLIRILRSTKGSLIFKIVLISLYGGFVLLSIPVLINGATLKDLEPTYVVGAGLLALMCTGFEELKKLAK